MIKRHNKDVHKERETCWLIKGFSEADIIFRTLEM